MKRLLLAVSLMAGSAPAHAVTGAELLRQCETLLAGARVRGEQVTLPRQQGAAECWFYMAAIQDISATVEQEGGPSLLGACVPGRTTRIELIKAFVDYARQQPEVLQLRATVLLIAALDQGFPCPSTR